MFKKRYYVILGILVLGVILVLTIVIKKEDFKEKTQGQIQLNEQTELIMQHLKRGEYNLVIKLGKEYLASNPNDITVINLLTEAYINNNDLSAAEETVRRGIAIQTSDPWSCRLLARIYRIKPERDPVVKNNNLTLALELAERSLASNPDDISLLAEAAQIYSEQGDKVKANQAIDRALSIVPNEAYLKSVKEAISRIPEKKIKK